MPDPHLWETIRPRIKLDRLPGLHRAMTACNLARCTFRFRRNRAVFDVFLLTDTNPFELMFGFVGGQFFLPVQVLRGYQVGIKLAPRIYTELCRVLGLTYDPDNPFSPRAFFNDPNHAIPPNLNQAAEPQPDVLAGYHYNLEDPETIYFVCRRPHGDAKGRCVTNRNLCKSRHLLGKRARRRCRDGSISTVRTDDPATAANDWRNAP